MLFLDEIALYRSDILESLRGPIEDGRVQIARSGGAIWFPCSFSLVAAMNPCPCGYRDDPSRVCECSPQKLTAYRGRMSGPLLDRFDITCQMTRVGKSELMGGDVGESSEVVRARVVEARERQTRRYGTSLITNASAPKAVFDKASVLEDDAVQVLEEAIDRSNLTGRGVGRVLRISQTLADLRGAGRIGSEDVSEAVDWRMFDDVAELVS